MIKKDFKNIQVQARPDLFTLFQDTFEQSGTNSKSEFLGLLLEGYLNPDHEAVVKKIEADSAKERESFESEIQSLKDENQILVKEKESFESEIQSLKDENQILEREKEDRAGQAENRAMFSPEIAAMIQPTLDKHLGEKARFINPETKETEEIEVNTLENALIVILKSIKIN